jgi:hypothetical protein
MVKEKRMNETHSPTVKFIYLYLEILASISADFPLFYQIHNEVSTVRLQMHDPIFVKAMVDEWKDLYTHMSDKMHVAMISLLNGHSPEIQPVLQRLRLYEICAESNAAVFLFHRVNRIMHAANDCACLMTQNED